MEELKKKAAHREYPVGGETHQPVKAGSGAKVRDKVMRPVPNEILSAQSVDGLKRRQKNLQSGLRALEESGVSLRTTDKQNQVIRRIFPLAGDEH